MVDLIDTTNNVQADVDPFPGVISILTKSAKEAHSNWNENI
jgi:hypothetical protein